MVVVFCSLITDGMKGGSWVASAQRKEGDRDCPLYLAASSSAWLRPLVGCWSNWPLCGFLRLGEPKQVTNILSDTNTYETLWRDPTSSKEKKVIFTKTGKRQSHWQTNILQTVPQGSHSIYHGLPKIHKEGAHSDLSSLTQLLITYPST